MRYTFYLSIAVVTAFSMFGCSGRKIDQPEITKDELHESVEFLASDSLKGRFPGTPEDNILSDWIASQFRQAGLKMLFNDGLQPFEVTVELEAGKGNALGFEGFSGTVGEDIAPFTFSANASHEGEVIFAGYGFDIDGDSLKWHDYEGIDVKGKWVMILRGDPELDNPDSPFATFSDDRNKVMAAEDHGAGGVLLVSGVGFDQKDGLDELRVKKSPVAIPVLQIKRTVANKILEKSGKSIEELEKALNEKRAPLSFATGVTAKGSSEINEKKVKTWNIVGMLEGTDEQLKDEYIVIGAHKDHLGMGGPNTGSRKPDTLAVHNGADDNASGTAVLLELVEKMAWQHDSLRRSVIFVAFGAEEMGLLGSKYFVENPPVELSKIKAMINVDMVGRLRDNNLQVGGTGTSKQSEDILNSIPHDSLNLAFTTEGYGPSDHASFYGKDIPVFFFSTGAHLDYHTPFDDTDSVNFDGLEKIGDYIFGLAWTVANMDSALVFQEAGPKEGVSRSRRRGKGVTLGIMPDFSGTEKRGLRADFVIKGKPAALGGMKDGDIITAINGKPVKNIYDYMYRLSKLKFGQTISVEVLRDGEKKILIIQL